MTEAETKVRLNNDADHVNLCMCVFPELNGFIRLQSRGQESFVYESEGKMSEAQIENNKHILRDTAFVNEKYVKFTYPQGYNRRIKITNFDNWVKKNGPHPIDIQDIFNAMSKIAKDVCEAGLKVASERDISRRYGSSNKKEISNKEEIIKFEFEVKKDGKRIRHLVFEKTHRIIVETWNGSEYVDLQVGVAVTTDVAFSMCKKFCAWKNTEVIFGEL